MTMFNSIKTRADLKTRAATLQEFNDLRRIGTETRSLVRFGSEWRSEAYERKREKISSLGCVWFVSYAATGLCY
jgi:hypothetical protein